MPSLESLLPFALALAALQLSPGPDMLLILDRGIVYGARVAFSTIAGVVLIAGTVQIGMLVLGLGTLLHDRPSSLLVLRAAGAAYLCYLGVRMLTTRLSVPECVHRRPDGAGRALWEGAFSSLTNPKSFLFLFVVLPQFVDPHIGPVWSQMLALGLLHKLAGLVTLGSIALAAEPIGRLLRRRPRLLSIQRNCCGVLMMAIGAVLATRIPIPA